MAKITQQHVVNFLQERITQLRDELKKAEDALSALGTGSSETAAPKRRGRKPGTAATSASSTSAKSAGKKRGRKPKAKSAASSTGGAKRGRKPKAQAATEGATTSAASADLG